MHLDNQHSLKDVLRDMVDSMHWKEKLHQTKIRQLWADKMGTTITQYTTEIMLRKDKLFLTITAASLRQELSYGKDKIKDMLNAELGEEVIREVIVR